MPVEFVGGGEFATDRDPVTSFPVPVPPGTKDGHLMVLVAVVNNPILPTNPEGWTSVATRTETNRLAVRISQRFAFSEPDLYNVTVPLTEAVAYIMTYSGVVVGIQAIAMNNATLVNPFATPGVITLTANAMVIHGAVSRTVFNNPLGGGTGIERFSFATNENGRPNTKVMEAGLQASPGATGTQSFTNGQDEFWVNYTFAMQAALGTGHHSHPDHDDPPAVNSIGKKMIMKGLRIKNPVRRIIDPWGELRRK